MIKLCRPCVGRSRSVCRVCPLPKSVGTTYGVMNHLLTLWIAEQNGVDLTTLKYGKSAQGAITSGITTGSTILVTRVLLTKLRESGFLVATVESKHYFRLTSEAFRVMRAAVEAWEDRFGAPLV